MDALHQVLTQVEHLASSFDSATVSRARTVVEELFANSVSHGGRQDGSGVVVALSVIAWDGELRLHYEDQFAQVEPHQDHVAAEQKAGQPVERRAAGGVGRLLAGRLADEVRYARQRGRNCIDLRFIPRRST